MSDDDEDEVEYDFSVEDAKEAINWAVDVGATITLMYHESTHDDDAEGLEKLGRWLHIVERIYDAMPEAVSDPAHDVAVAAIDRAEFEEEQVEEFLEQIKDL